MAETDVSAESARFSGRTAAGPWFAEHVWHPLRSTILENYAKQQYPLGYTPALDGLRGLMTVGVFVAHVRYPLVPGAMVFMDVFYVMSGYFITALLVRDFDRHGRIRFGEFYRRRFARILPPFAIMVAAYLVFRALFYPPFGAALTDAAIGFTYIANWWRAFDLPGIAYMSHTWSLAMEEQFYLLWPVLLLVLVRTLGVSWRTVAVIAIGALLIWAWRIYLTTTNPPFWRLYNGLDTRSDALLVGCALAIVLKLSPAGTFPRFERVLPRLAWPLLIGSLLVVFFFVDYKDHMYYYVGIMLVGALPGSLMVVLLLRTSGTILHLLLERPEAVFLGKIFYGVYLWHFPILLLITDLTGASYLVRFVVGFPLTLLCATLSYAYVERHFMRVRVAPARAPLPQVSA